MDPDREDKMTDSAKKCKNESDRIIIKHKGRGCGFRGHGRGAWLGQGAMRCGRGMMKSFNPPGYGKDRAKNGALNGFMPLRGPGRLRPYPDPRLYRCRAGPPHLGPLRPPPPPLHHRGPFPPARRHGPPPLPPPPPPPPPLGHPGFRGRLPHPRGRGVPPPGPPRHFLLPRGPRGCHSGPASPPPAPPGGRRF